MNPMINAAVVVLPYNAATKSQRLGETTVSLLAAGFAGGGCLGFALGYVMTGDEYRNFAFCPTHAWRILGRAKEPYDIVL
jgi:hypothetical protein